MDVQRNLARHGWSIALAAALILGLALRLRGIHDPILDHPGWRQGDTAAIARNFATLDLNPFHPQTDYDGPPPNYVELELQIVPFLAALLYKLFGVHEIFGRLISLGFSLGTIALAGFFARWMFASRIAGAVAAFAFAVYPGSVYYGRTFTPDTTMTFFATAAVFASARWIVDDEMRPGRSFWLAAGCTALAILAKPVALAVLVPIATAMVFARGIRGVAAAPLAYAFFAIALVPYAAYDHYVASIAEWHWASGITRLHVIPSLFGAFASPGAFWAKFVLFRHAFGMLRTTMLGTAGFVLLVMAAAYQARSRCTPLLYAWLVAVTLYAYLVVTVERVDYYLYLFLPLAAVWTGGLAIALYRGIPPARRGLLAAAGALVLVLATIGGRGAVAAYYHYPKAAYVRAKALDATLPPEALIVMGHYDPSVLYYIHRKGWEEDPYLWTPFDEESAIAKGARYFIAVEPHRLARNVELSAWLERFPLENPSAAWPVYETDPTKLVPGAEARWQAFRRREKHLAP